MWLRGGNRYSPSLLVGGCRHAVYASKVLARTRMRTGAGSSSGAAGDSAAGGGGVSGAGGGSSATQDNAATGDDDVDVDYKRAFWVSEPSQVVP